MLKLCFPLLAALLLAAPARADDLAAQIDKVITGPDYRQARWGLLVVEARTGRVVYEQNADRLFMPASVTKLYSCAAALAAYGPDHRFETPVYARGELKDGRLRGDLILVAQGDLTLGGRTDEKGRLAFKDHDHIYANFSGGAEADITATDPLAGLKALARRVREAGVRRVEGDVLIDDRLFARARGSGSGPDLVTPIVVNDNLVDVLVSPGAKVGEPATVRMHPETALIRMDAQVTTAPEGASLRLTLHRDGPDRFSVRGQIALRSRRIVRIYPVDDPSAFARALFIEALRREGVDIEASPLAPPQADLPEKSSYARLTRVAHYESPPFGELIKVTLKVSHNLYASTLPLLLAVREGQRTLPEGLKLQRRFLSDLGVPVPTISFGGGAGGAIADSVTPRATVQLLQAMQKRPEWEVYKASLPILGVDGTLEGAVPATSPARGKVFAKTGTLTYDDVMNGRSLLRSKALGGVMTSASGRELAFTIFVNDVPLPPGVTSSREGKVLGRLCEIIHKHAP